MGVDDPAVGLVKEPFVGGVPEMIEAAIRAIPDARGGFLAVFSAGYFPDARIVLERVRSEGSGTVYRWPETGQEGCRHLRRCLQATERFDAIETTFRDLQKHAAPRIPCQIEEARLAG